jgi:hypothetical protein
LLSSLCRIEEVKLVAFSEKALIWKLSLLLIVCRQGHLHSQHLRGCCLVLMLSFRRWLLKSRGHVLSLQKECSNLQSLKAKLESSNDMHKFDCISKPSSGCSEDCKSFDYVSLSLETSGMPFVFVLIFSWFLKSYFDIHLLFFFIPFILSLLENLQTKQNCFHDILVANVQLLDTIHSPYIHACKEEF